mgnify:CR=1 FL=1
MTNRSETNSFPNSRSLMEGSFMEKVSLENHILKYIEELRRLERKYAIQSETSEESRRQRERVTKLIQSQLEILSVNRQFPL